MSMVDPSVADTRTIPDFVSSAVGILNFLSDKLQRRLEEERPAFCQCAVLVLSRRVGGYISPPPKVCGLFCTLSG